jgi:hypothetical protein
MSDDFEYLKKYKPDHLYTHPGAKGAYATIAGESEEVVGEIDVTSRCKLAVSAFHVHDSTDFGTFKITKLQFHKTHGWREDGHIQVNQFQLAQIKESLSIISSLDLSELKKTRLSLDNLQVGALGTLLSSTKGAALISELAKSPELHQDIYAVAAKRAALAEFKEKLNAEGISAPDWPGFFERETGSENDRQHVRSARQTHGRAVANPRRSESVCARGNRERQYRPAAKRHIQARMLERIGRGRRYRDPDTENDLRICARPFSRRPEGRVRYPDRQYRLRRRATQLPCSRKSGADYRQR